MTIETKYSIGQHVYWLSNNKVECGAVYSINVHAGCVGDEALRVVKYHIYGLGEITESENAVFLSKADLLASL